MRNAQPIIFNTDLIITLCIIIKFINMPYFMRIFKYKSFDRWASSERLSDKILQKALIEMNNGLYEADLGSGLYKKRIALQGKGKSGGYRTLIAFQSEKRLSFFLVFLKMNARIFQIMIRRFIRN